MFGQALPLHFQEVRQQKCRSFLLSLMSPVHVSGVCHAAPFTSVGFVLSSRKTISLLLPEVPVMPMAGICVHVQSLQLYLSKRWLVHVCPALAKLALQ